MKKKNGWSIIFVFLLGISLVTNVYLYQGINTLSNKVDQISENTPSTNNASNAEVKNVVHNVTSETTKVVSEVNESVVGVAVYTRSGSGSGSGVIYEKEGNDVYIVTNHHVIDGATSVDVMFSNGETLAVEVVGSDRYLDLALLKVTTTMEVTPIKIGDSNLLQVGEEVIAIGSPLGLEFAGTTTKGIISGVNRVISVDIDSDGVDDWDTTVIQTDAAINPGNSGGALINMEGELVGITSMKIADQEVEGIGFAIPITDVKDAIAELKETGKITRPTLGLKGTSLESMSSYMRYASGIETNRDHGIYVSEVIPNSAAEAAGIQKGDIIIGFNGEEITAYKQFLTKLYSQSPKDTVQIEVERKGEIKSFAVVLD